MTNLPKDLQDIMFERSCKFASFEERLQFQVGFNFCYQTMLKTHVPRDKVEKLVTALKWYDGYCTDIGLAKQALKEFEGKE